MELTNYRGEGVDEIFPQIPKHFIESYAKNPVDEVELEYEDLLCPVTTEKCGDPCKSKAVCESGLTVKLVNNEVVVVESYIQSAGRMTRVMKTGFKVLDELLSKGASPSDIVGQKTCGPLICKNNTADTDCKGGKCSKEKTYTREDIEQAYYAGFAITGEGFNAEHGCEDSIVEEYMGEWIKDNL